MKEFYPNTLGLQLKGANGQFVDFAGVALMGERKIWRVDFTNKRSLECSSHHKLFAPEGLIEVSELEVGQRVIRGDGRFTRVKAITDTGRVEPVYDIIEASDGHRYVCNGVLSSNCEFITDDPTLINPLMMDDKFKGISPKFYIEQSRWYVEPEPNCTYIFALDPAMGTKNDSAAIQAFMLPGMIQIAEWQSNTTDPVGQMRMLRIMMEFLVDELMQNPDQEYDPEIYWTFENNSLGEANRTLIDLFGEEHFPGQLVNERKRRGQAKKFRQGMHTAKHSKMAACAYFKNLFEGRRMTVNSGNLAAEMKNYVKRGVGYAAKPGMHDDLISATLLAVRLLHRITEQGVEVGTDIVSGFGGEEDDDAMPIVT